MIKTKFKKSFNEALEQGYYFHTQFLIDKADFEAFSPQFIDPFAANFLADLQAADALPTHDDDLGEQTLLTSHVEAKMEECRVEYQDLLAYVRLVWPDDEMVAGDFGARVYEKARKSAPDMINLMQKAKKKADSADYKADLIAAGFLQTDIDKLGTLATELDTVNNTQREYVEQSVHRTKERVDAFNKFWDTMVIISDISKRIWVDDEAQIEMYLLYPDEPTPLPPAAPQNLTFLPSSFMFSWDPVATATSYQLVFKLTVNNDWIDAYTGSGTSFNFNPGNGIWQFRCRARNSGGFGPWSDIITVQLPTTLDPPYNVSVMNDPDPVSHNVITFSIVPEATSVDVYVSIVPLGGDEGMYNFDGNFSPVSPIERNVGTGLRYWYYLIAKAGTESSLESTHVYVDVS